MDHHSTLDQRTPPPTAEETGASDPIPSAGVAAGIAAANAFVPILAEPARFPGEDGGQSLAEMAQSDLDAALQLLADRAHYITGASGAAIALRRGEHPDMRCRASAGSNAPELGSLLSMEYGLSGESVRTQQALLCDDTETDSRVNREGCRQLGIASVIVMPIVSDGQVLGVFELFSGKPHAFSERDLSALRRLSEMVETAVKHSAVPESFLPTEVADAPEKDSDAQTDEVEVTENGPETLESDPDNVTDGLELTFAPEPEAPAPVDVDKVEVDNRDSHKKEAESAIPVPQKPMFWSAGAQTAANTEETGTSIAVPAVLRNLQKCEACGFPVSQGRTFCVECEEKSWRGQPLQQASVPTVSVAASQTGTGTETLAPAPVERAISTVAEAPASSDFVPFLESTPPAESWLATNKYIVVAFLIAVIVAMILLWMH